MIFPGGQKKKIWLYLYCHVAGQKGSLPNFTYWSSLCLPDNTGCGGRLINQSRNPINNVRKKDRVSADEETKKPTRHLQQPVNQRKFPQLLLQALTLADDTELYILPAMDELMMVRDIWRLMSICLKGRQLDITQHLQWLGDLGIGVFFSLWCAKLKTFLAERKRRIFHGNPMTSFSTYPSCSILNCYLEISRSWSQQISSKTLFVLFKRASVGSLLSSDLPWSPSWRKRQRRSKMTTSISRTITCNTQMGLVRIWLWLHYIYTCLLSFFQASRHSNFHITLPAHKHQCATLLSRTCRPGF